MPWTVEQALALAPDPASAKSGKDLSSARKWKTLGVDAACAWGTIQGSGKDPYQTSIDLGGPAFKCSCPSRKFPCKHGLGLLLILAQQPAALTEKTPPTWTSEWLAKRVEKEEKKAAKAAEPEVPPDPETAARAAAAAEKRAAARENKVTAGLDDLGVWLRDLVRTGFAVLPGKPPSFWEAPATRLVDAQAPGLARRVSDLDNIATRGEDWPVRLLRETARMHLAREAWSRIDRLPADTQADLRSTLGFSTNQEDVLASEGVHDQWLVVGRRITEEERLRVQRTWLFGHKTRRPALCLSFSAGPNQPLDVSLVPGDSVEAELAFFPSAWPLRALVKQRFGPPESTRAEFPQATIAEACAFAAQALAAQPWLERVPFALKAVFPVLRSEGWRCRDEARHWLPLRTADAAGWTLRALSGGKPLALAGEWDGESLVPLSVRAEGRFLVL
ncbi:MAG TPA: SWIM zinc finger family protein [Verrucomicrobiota bacterium]|nr:SWIM zinc finger family protein [Verrucomicrobiota bacterium]